jgi:quinol monooxygenase YgiN
VEERLYAFLGAVVSAVKSCPGCISCRLLRSTEDPGQFIIIEEWESIESHQQAASAIPPERLQEAIAMLGKPAHGMYYKT